MSARKPTTPEGIRRRHSRACRSHEGKACNCSPSWEAFVYLKREKKKERKTFTDLDAAKSWRTDKLSAGKQRRLRAATKMTVREAAEKFIEGAIDGSVRTASKRRYKPATVRSYKRALDLRLLDDLGHLQLSDVEQDDVQDLADRLQADGLDASTIQNTLDPLRAIYRWAIRRKWLSFNPTVGLDLPRPDGKRKVEMTSPAEAAALLAALTEDRALWATALYAGLRRGELMALRWSDVDLAEKVIHVQRGWDVQEGEQAPKSEAGERDVPILDLLAPLLREHRIATGRRGDDLVFGRVVKGEDGREVLTAFPPTTVMRRAQRAWKKAGLTGVGLHEARHVCASVFIASKANPKEVQKLMGHATITMTFDVYGHLWRDGLDEAAVAANAYLARLTGDPAALKVVGS